MAFKTPIPPGGPREMTAEESSRYETALEEQDAETQVEAEKQRQFEASEGERFGEPWAGYTDKAVEAIMGAGMVAISAPEGMPFQNLTPSQRMDYLWRSIGGDAATAQRQVRGKAEVGRSLPASQEVTNIRAQARAARGPSPAPVELGGSTLSGVAAPLILSAPVISFVAGEREGTFAETQTLEGQIGALARFSKGPLGTDDLNESALKRLSDDPASMQKLRDQGYITSEVVDEASRRQEKSLMTKEYRAYLMQKYHTETDPIIKSQYLQMVKEAE